MNASSGNGPLMRLLKRKSSNIELKQGSALSNVLSQLQNEKPGASKWKSSAKRLL
jgi:hypothetical protein